MNIISKRKLLSFWKSHSDVERPLLRWYYFARKAKWKRWKELQADFPSADKVGDRVIFNVKGNNYRLIVVVRFFNNHIYLRWFGSHAEYDKLTKEDILNL